MDGRPCDRHQCARISYWITWIIVCSIPKLGERVGISLVYRYLLTLIRLDWAAVISGAAIGILLSSVFWVLDALIDPSNACVAYVVVFSYYTGIVVMGFLVVTRVIEPFTFEASFPNSENWYIKPRSPSLGGYIGLLAGLSIACVSLILRDTNQVVQNATHWCELAGFPAYGWGFTFLIVGFLSGLCSMKTIGVYSEYSQHVHLQKLTNKTNKVHADDDEITDNGDLHPNPHDDSGSNANDDSV